MKKNTVRAVRIAVLGAFLVALTSYVLLDAFVTEHAISEGNIGQSSTSESGDVKECEILNAYSDNEMSVVLKHYREYETDIYLADIRIDSPEYLKCAFARNTYGRNIKEKTSDMARRVGAVVAVNGDYYGARELGFVIRNGELFRSAPDVNLDALVIYENGDFDIVNQREKRAARLVAEGARHVFTFGPGLVENGEITVTRGDEVAQSMTSNPRTAVGRIDEGHLVLLVSDGRTSSSEGLSLYELASFLKELGVSDAYNLDGGGSSTMCFMGEIVNYPTTDGKKFSERSVSDIVYIGY